MILHGIRVRDWGPFREEIALDDLSPGLNVLAGPNGSGKSTLARAIRHALFDRHGSNTDGLRRLRPWGTELGPRVVLELTCGGTRYRVEKTYLESPRAALVAREDGVWRRLAEGRAAEESLDDVLGLRRGRGSLRPEDRGPVEVLWVEQGRTTSPPSPNLVTRERLRAVVGEALDAGDAGRVARRVEAEWSRHFTPTGRVAKGSDRMRLEAELSRVREDCAGAERRLADLTRAEEDLRRWNGERSAREAALADTRKRLALALKLERSRRAVQDARAAWKTVNDRLREIEEVRASMSDQQAGADEARAEVAALDGDLERAGRAEARGRLRDLDESLERVRKAGRLLDEARSERESAAAIGAVPDGALREIERIESEIAGVRGDAESSAARIRLTPAADLTGTAQGTPLELGAGDEGEWTAAAPFRLEIDGVGSIEVFPPGAEEREARLAALRERRGAISPEPHDELRRRAEEVRTRRARAGTLSAQAGGLLNDREPDERRAELESRREEILAEHPGLDSDAPDGDAPAAESLRARDRDARDRLASSEAGLAAARDRLGALTADGLDDAAREAERRARLEELDLAEQRLAALGDEDASPESLDAEVERSRRGLEEARIAIGRAERTLEIGRREELDARLRRLREEETEMETRHRAAVARAEAAGLLHDVLERHRRESLEQVMTPVLERVREDLPRIVDPTYAALEVDEATQVAEAVRLERDDRVVELADLSFGTREQVLLLARLALGESLARDERELVVLDDALVNTDAARRARLLDRLAEAAEHLQILILTCHPEHYEALGAATRVFDLEAAVSGTPGTLTSARA